MTSLTELSNVELRALARLTDEYQHTGDGPDPRPSWRALVDAEVRRRMEAVVEGQRILDEARAARGG